MLRQLYTLLIIFTCSLLFAQTGEIRGVIKTADQQPGSMVSVGIKGTTYGASANSQGEYVIRNMSAGEYTLSVSFVGLEPEDRIVTVKEGQVTTVPEIILKENELKLNEVMVTTVRTMNEKPLSIGKTSIKPMDLPQSIASIDKDVIVQQQTQDMGDVLRNFNGVYVMGNTGGVQQEIAGRGFAYGSSNTFKNGVRFNNAITPEMSSLERAEVLKGSAAILFGNVAPGGVINLVTKKPTFTQGGEVSFRAGSYDLYKPTIDVYSTIDEKKNLAFRFNTSYETANSFRDDVSSERIYLNPSVAWKIGKKTDLLVEGDYLRDNRTADFGVGTINYEIVDIPRNSFIGIKWSSYKTEQKSATATITHHFNSRWQLKSVTSTQRYNNDLFGNFRPNSNSQFVKADGNWVRGVQRTAVNENYGITQLDLTGRFSTGSIGHNLLIGGDLDQYETSTLAYNPLNKYDSVNVYDLSKFQQRNDIPNLTERTTTKNPVKRAGFYAQDLVSLTSKIKLLAGARLSYLETASSVLTHASGSVSETKQYDFAVTPRLGLVYQPSRKMSLFGSYANSFSPNTGVDVNGNSLAPSMIDQYEAGVKTNLFNEVMSANITAYQIVNSNLAQTSLENGNTNSNIKELSGEVTSKGVEIDLMSKSLCGFVIIGGYSFNETRYTRSNTYEVGSLLRYNPNHTANASLYYNFCQGKLKGVSLGASSVYIGERQAGRSTRVTVENDVYRLIPLEAYTLVDAHVGYSFNKVSIRLKASNIFNVLSYNAHDDNSINPIAPRQLLATLSCKF